MHWSNFKNFLKYDKLGLAYLNCKNNINVYVTEQLFVANDFSALSQFDSLLVYLKKVSPIVMQLNKSNLGVRFYYILGLSKFNLGLYIKKMVENGA